MRFTWISRKIRMMKDTTRTYAMLAKPVSDTCNLCCEYCYYSGKRKLLKMETSRMSQLFYFKWESLMVQMLGFNPNPVFNADYLMGAGWYLSSMFIAMIPAYYLASRFPKGYSNVIAPLSAACFYCYTLQQYGTLDVGNQIALFTMLGNLRAFAGPLYSQKLNKMNQEKPDGLL